MSSKKTSLTAEQLRRFFYLLRLVYSDVAEEVHNDVYYYIDADVAVPIIGGLEVQHVKYVEQANARARVVRALMSCGIVGQLRILRPHALEVYEYLSRLRHAGPESDEAFRDRVNLFTQRCGITGYLRALSDIASQHRATSGGKRKQELVEQFLELLTTGGDTKFAAIEALRGTWTQRTRRFCGPILVFDKALGPEIRDFRSDDIEIYSRMLQFFERHSQTAKSHQVARPYSSNVHDALALTGLAHFCRLRKTSRTSPLVRFYSETDVVVTAIQSDSELSELFREPIRSESYSTIRESSIFRDAEYFLMRARFFEVLSSNGSQDHDSLDSVIDELKDLDNKSDDDLMGAVPDLERHLRNKFGGVSLTECIEDLEGLRLVRATWARAAWADEVSQHIGSWVEVFNFAQSKETIRVLDAEIDDVLDTLKAQVSRLKRWCDDHDRIRAIIKEEWHSKNSPRERFSLKTFLDDPVAHLGLTRWGVHLSDASVKKLSELIQHLYDADEIVWADACRRFTPLIGKATSDAETARIVSSVLWLIREYRWVENILFRFRESSERNGGRCEEDLVVWQAAAWIRGARGLEADPPKAAIARCEECNKRLEAYITTSRFSKVRVAQLWLGWAYVLFHCWRRVSISDGLPEKLKNIHRGWVAQSLALAVQAKSVLPQRSLEWGLASNHCAYVGMVCGAESSFVGAHMADLTSLEADPSWTARFSDTAAYYCMWLFDRFQSNPPERKELYLLLDRAAEHLQTAKRLSIGDIAISDHELRLQQLRLGLRESESKRPSSQ